MEVATGAVTTLAGSGEEGDADGVGDAAEFYNPSGIAISRDGGMLFVADFSNNKIRRVEEVATGAVTTIAGSGIKGSADGVGDAAQFCCPAGIAISPDGGVLFVADFENHMIRRVEVATGEVTTLAGSGESSMNSGPTSTRRSSRTWLRGGLPTRRAQSRTSPRRETVRRASATTACATDPRCPQRC